MKQAAGQTVVREDETCSQLFFLIDGRLTLTTTSDDHRYQVEEQLSAPWLLQPEALFGAHPQYSCTVTTMTESHFITVSKDEVMRLLDDFLIIRLNYLNMLATLSQRRGRQPWRRCPENLRQRIVRFFRRLDVSRVLNALQTEGLLHLRRGIIEIPSLEHLLM